QWLRQDLLVPGAGRDVAAGFGDGILVPRGPVGLYGAVSPSGGRGKPAIRSDAGVCPLAGFGTAAGGGQRPSGTDRSPEPGPAGGAAAFAGTLWGSRGLYVPGPASFYIAGRGIPG